MTKHRVTTVCTPSTRGPTAGLLAQVLVAKYLDHLPLYRQEVGFPRLPRRFA